MPYVYPTNRELSSIAPEKIARASANRVGFQVMPMRDVRAAVVAWSQADNYFGLQQLRGLDGAPTHVKPVGLNRYTYEPGVYGEFMTVTETELTLRSGSVMGDVPVPVEDLVLERQDQLIVRELDRIEFMIWTLLTTGTFSVALPGGQVGFTDTFTLQTASAAVAWGTSATATPLADFRSVALLGAGKGVQFGAGARAYMNRVTANKLMANTNASDLAGRRIGGGNTLLSIADINMINVSQDAPTIVVYDEGYYNDSNVFTRFIANDKVVVVGQVTNGERIGEYVKTLNANNPGRAPGSYSFVVDRANGTNGEKRVPPNMEVHQGHNGGPVLYRPGSIVVLTVS
jgi:hypothetical protein